MAQILPLHMNESGLSESVLTKAAELVQSGGVLAVPTESFYALGASAWHEGAAERVCAIKQRTDGKPILVLIADLAQLTQLVMDVTPGATLLMNRFWPGPLTLIFRASRDVPHSLMAGTGTVGVRQPAAPILAHLLRRTGPLTGTSANRAGQAPARTAAEVQAALGSDLDLILDGGPTAGGAPSTIVDTTGPLRIVREGPITRQQLRTVLAGSDVAQAF